ncbi:hypothetical protein [Streptacidiphilus sp. PAMC 29251]
MGVPPVKAAQAAKEHVLQFLGALAALLGAVLDFLLQLGDLCLACLLLTVPFGTGSFTLLYVLGPLPLGLALGKLGLHPRGLLRTRRLLALQQLLTRR